MKSERNPGVEEAFHKHTFNLLFQRSSLLCTSVGTSRSCFIVIDEALLKELRRQPLIESEMTCRDLFINIHNSVLIHKLRLKMLTLISILKLVYLGVSSEI